MPFKSSKNVLNRFSFRHLFAAVILCLLTGSLSAAPCLADSPGSKKTADPEKLKKIVAKRAESDRVIAVQKRLLAAQKKAAEEKEKADREKVEAERDVEAERMAHFERDLEEERNRVFF